MSAQSLPGSPRPSAEDVRAHVARLLASRAFPASGRPAKLLGYLVEQTLAGRGDRVKAYDLAVSVLGRDASFDPQVDPIVRVEVGRLRRELDHYYLTDGRPSPFASPFPRDTMLPCGRQWESPQPLHPPSAPEHQSSASALPAAIVAPQAPDADAATA